MKSKRFKLSLVFLFVLVIVFLFSGCTACAREQWQQVYDAYTNEKYKDRFVYHNITAEIKDSNVFLYDKKSMFTVYSEPQIEYNYNNKTFYFVDESIPILEQAGFFNDINENTVITFTVNSYIGWDGWCYPVFAVAIGEKTYLDFETGKENVLNYVKQRIEDPLGN